jgi:putative transposase
MNRIKPANDEVYHIYNRGVEKRKIFLDNQDHFRFIHSLYEFNDKNPTLNFPIEVRLPKDKKREVLVEILAYCLMPNHFHLMLRQVKENGITEFMRKMGTGYTNYFNKKNKRVGSLFQGKYKMTHIQKESHYIYLPYYIHFNPLKLVGFDWKENTVEDFEKSIEFLENYRWSSFQNYIGTKNFPSLINEKFISEFFGGPESYRKSVRSWLKKSSNDYIEVGLR